MKNQKTRYELVKHNRLLKELKALETLENEYSAGNNEAAKLYSMIQGVRTFLEANGYNRCNKKRATDHVLEEFLREVEFFLINQAAKFGKPRSYLQSLRVKKAEGKKQPN